jgi:hypothetical protein
VVNPTTIWSWYPLVKISYFKDVLEIHIWAWPNYLMVIILSNILVKIWMLYLIHLCSWCWWLLSCLTFLLRFGCYIWSTCAAHVTDLISAKCSTTFSQQVEITLSKCLRVWQQDFERCGHLGAFNGMLDTSAPGQFDTCARHFGTRTIRHLCFLLWFYVQNFQ